MSVYHLLHNNNLSVLLYASMHLSSNEHVHVVTHTVSPEKEGEEEEEERMVSLFLFILFKVKRYKIDNGREHDSIE